MSYKINKHELKFAILPKSQFHQVHVYVTYLWQLSSKVKLHEFFLSCSDGTPPEEEEGDGRDMGVPAHGGS